MTDPKRRGRPRLDEARVDVHVRLPARQFEVLCREAHARAVSVPEMIRRHLADPGKDFRAIK